MSKKCDHLNDCLERLLQGEDLESCLKDYPKEAEELRLLLKTAGGITRFAKAIKPRPEFAAQTRANLGETYYAKYCSWKARIAGILKPAGRFAAVAAVAIVLLCSVFAGGVTLSALAAEGTMPGETLYPVKLATEQIKTTFAFSNDKKVSYLTQFAEARAEEMGYAVEKKDDAQLEAALEKLERNLARVEKIISPGNTSSVIAAASEQEPPGLQKIERTVKDSSAKVKNKLKEIKEPDPEKKDKIIKRVDQAYLKAINAVESAKANKAVK